MKKSEIDMLISLVCANAYMVYGGTLIGDPPPRIQRRRELCEPKPGGWAIEVSTIGLPEKNFNRLGRLILIGNEIVEESYPDEWDEETDGAKQAERVWYIERIDGTLFRWHNADFIAVQTDPFADSSYNSEATKVFTQTQERQNWVIDAIKRHGLKEKLAAGSLVQLSYPYVQYEH